MAPSGKKTSAKETSPTSMHGDHTPWSILGFLHDRDDSRLIRHPASNVTASIGQTASEDSVKAYSLLPRDLTVNNSRFGLSSGSYGGSIPYPSGSSMNTSIGIRSVPSIRRDLIMDDAGLIKLHLPNPPPRYECPFDRLDCLRIFISFDHWYDHSLTHFGNHGPPLLNSCCFCALKFEGKTGKDSWRARLEHVKLHHDQGEQLATSRLDAELYRYLWSKHLIDDIHYKDLTAGAMALGKRSVPRQHSIFSTRKSLPAELPFIPPGTSSKKVEVPAIPSEKVELPFIPPKKETIHDPHHLILATSQIRSTIHQTSHLSGYSTVLPNKLRDYPGYTPLGFTLTKPFKDYLGTNQKLFLGHLISSNLATNNVLRAVVECHRRLGWISLMMVYLQKTGFIQSDLTILIQQASSPQLVDLIRLRGEIIVDLALYFDRVLGAYLADDADQSDEDLVNDLDLCCKSFFRSAGLNVQHSIAPASFVLWNRTIDLLDLAICLHCEAHRVADHGSETNGFPFIEASKLKSGWTCRPREASCLAAFFANQKIWVCSLLDSYTDDIKMNEATETLPITIRTTISTFSIVWGPVSQVEIGDGIVQYNVGRGCIAPWANDECDETQTANAEQRERNCHWMPFDLAQENSIIVETSDQFVLDTSTLVEEDSSERLFNRAEAENLSDDDALSDIVGYEDIHPCLTHADLPIRAEYARNHPFGLEDVLIIGARKRGDTGLQQIECTCSSTKFQRILKKKGIERLLTTRETITSFKKGPIGATVGFSAVGITANAKQDFVPDTSKRFYAETLIIDWEHWREFCHPKHLQVNGGVMISRCTRNAVRCSILDLFGTPSIKRLIREFYGSRTSIEADQACWDVFLLGEPTDIIQAWENNMKWRCLIGDIVHGCLMRLQYSGLDTARSVFNVLWMPPGEMLVKRLALDLKRHDWLNLLCDGPETCAMAVLIEDCLSIQIDGQREQFCNTSENRAWRSVLQTAISIDDSLPPFSGKRLCTSQRRPSIHQEESRCHCYPLKLESGYFCAAPGEDLYIAKPFHRLMSIGSLSSDHLVLQWNPSSALAFVNFWRSNPVVGAGHQAVFEEDEDALLIHVRHSKSPNSELEGSAETALQTMLRWAYR